MNYEKIEDLHVYDAPGNGQKTLGIPVSSHRKTQYGQLIEKFKKKNINIIKNVRQAVYSELDQLQSLLDRLE